MITLFSLEITQEVSHISKKKLILGDLEVFPLLK